MGTQCYINAYLNAINNHNKKATEPTGTYSGTGVLGQADEKKNTDEQDDQTLDLNDDQEKKKDQNVQDQDEELIDDDQGDEEEDFDLGQGDEQLEEEPQSETNPQELNTQNEVAFNFPDALLTEFINTVNQYTRLCADIVQNKSVTKSKQQNLDKLVGKMKNLIQAAQKSVE